MDFIETILRFISYWLDNLIYGFIPTVYNVLIDISETSIFTEEIFDLFASKVYALLGIFMLFKVSFSILSYIVDPDAFLDKSKGFGKLIGNVILTLVLLVMTPWIFSQAMEIQKIILRDNIIGKIFSTSGVNSNVVADPGNVMAYETFKAFYHIDTENHPKCVSGDGNAIANIDECKTSLGIEDKWDDLNNTLDYAFQSQSISIYMDYDLLYLKDQYDNYVMYYIPIISALAGGAILLLLIVFCFDIAVRSVKLGFLRMLAPVPIISRIDPKNGKQTFDKWVKTTISTYLDLFIRLLAIYFAVFVITQVIDLRFVDAATGLTKNVNVFVKVFIILGALLFAKQLPQLISDLTGVKMDGKFTLSPLKKLGEVPLAAAAVGAGGAMVGGMAANLYSGLRNNSGLGKLRAIPSAFAGGTSGFFRGGYAGFSGKGKDNIFKAISAGTKGSVDARNLRTSRQLADDGGIKGIVRRAGVNLENLAGVESGATKFDRQIAAYDQFLQEQSNLDSYVEGEIAKGKHRGLTSFEWTDVNGTKLRSTGNINVLKNQVESLKASGGSASDIANAELAYGAALAQAKQDYISANMTDGAISSMISNMNYIRETNSNYDGFSGMAEISDGESWDKSKKTIKKAKSDLTSSSEYRQAQINKKNDSKK